MACVLYSKWLDTIKFEFSCLNHYHHQSASRSVSIAGWLINRGTSLMFHIYMEMVSIERPSSVLIFSFGTPNYGNDRKVEEATSGDLQVHTAWKWGLEHYLVHALDSRIRSTTTRHAAHYYDYCYYYSSFDMIQCMNTSNTFILFLYCVVVSYMFNSFQPRAHEYHSRVIRNDGFFKQSSGIKWQALDVLN